MSEVRIAIEDILERTFEFGLRGDVIIQPPRCRAQLAVSGWRCLCPEPDTEPRTFCRRGTDHMIFAQFKQGSHNIFAGTSIAVTRPGIRTIGAIQHSPAEECIDLVRSGPAATVKTESFEKP